MYEWRSKREVLRNRGTMGRKAIRRWVQTKRQDPEVSMQTTTCRPETYVLLREVERVE
jgi:hypothetical protein